GVAGGRRGQGRRADPAAPRRPAAPAAAGAKATGPTGPHPGLGPATAAAPARGPLARAVAAGAGVRLRPAASAALEGAVLPVAAVGPRRAGQGGGGPGRGLPQAVHPAEHRGTPDRAADGGGVSRPLP